MNRIVLSLLLGAVAGVIDIIPMVAQKMDKYAISSAFIQWLALGFVISHIQFGVTGWLKGLITAIILVVPIIIIVMKAEPQSAIPILIMTSILGSLVGFAADKFIK